MATTVDAAGRHWARSVRLTAGLLVVWFLATFGTAFFARDLQAAWFGWPFSFWVAAQGAPLVYGALVWWYARAQARLERELGMAETE